ncbi:hypothetical protein CVT26_014102 [Gymnopilus dilepis]|uniref:Hydrophobin n=1 Tax=Gymnopilus dilepis TaxID=231916 RepID=A0A409Y855_9AGAR|nr:hypothetical protein CVT26_014102 [Gymnopilus dilepis]
MKFVNSIPALLALPILAAAQSVCTTGSLQCCEQVGNVSNSIIHNVLTLILGPTLPTITGLVGVECTAITGVGASASLCAETPVCCTNTTFPNDIIALGCSPVSVD